MAFDCIDSDLCLLSYFGYNWCLESDGLVEDCILIPNYII